MLRRTAFLLTDSSLLFFSGCFFRFLLPKFHSPNKLPICGCMTEHFDIQVFFPYSPFSSQLCAGTAQTNCILQREHYGHTVHLLHLSENFADLDTGHDNSAHLSINKCCNLADAFSCLNVGKAPLSLRVFLKSSVVLEKRLLQYVINSLVHESHLLGIGPGILDPVFVKKYVKHNEMLYSI